MVNLRNFATPLVAGAFILSAVTGVLIFFHLDSGLNKPAHEWLGLVLVMGAAMHVYTNFNGLKKHLSQPLGRGIVLAFVAILLLSFIPVGGEGNSGMRLAVDKVSSAPLTVVAELANQEPDALVERLKAKGFDVTSTSQSLKDIAGSDREKQMQLFSVVFASTTDK